MQDATSIIARTPAELEALRPAWERLAPANLDADIDFFSTVTSNLDKGAAPHVVYIREADGREMIAVARRVPAGFPLKLGYRQFASIKLDTLVLAFDGILGTRNSADQARLLGCLSSALNRGEADAMILGGLDSAGSLASAASGLAGGWRKLLGRGATRHWTADVGMRFTNFFDGRSSKTRQRLRSQQRKLERDYDGRLRFERFERPDQADELFRDMSLVASRSYQAGLGAAFKNSQLDRSIVELGLAKGWHRTWMLYLDGAPVAFWTGTAYAGVFAIGTPGFDPAFSKQSVGRYTMLRMIEDLCNDPAIHSLDFGGGDAEYKSAFGECRRHDRDVIIFAPRIRPLACNLVLSCLTAINNFGRRTASKSEWLAGLKNAWRDRHAGTGFPPPNPAGAALESGDPR